MSLILIKTAIDGTVAQITLPTAQIINVEASAHYTIIDSTTGKTPSSLQIVKTNNDLIIQQGTESATEELVKIEKFFEAETEASFAADGSSQLANTAEGNLITSSSEAFASSIAGESSLVWEGAAAQSGVTTGVSSAGVFSNTLLYSLAGGAAGLTAAGVAVASSSDSSSSNSSDPVLSVTISDGITGTATGDITYTFTFSDEVSDFTSDDIVVTGGTVGLFTVVDNTTYTLVVTPQDNSTDDIIVDIAANVATDATGLGNSAATNTQVVNTSSPSVVITNDVEGAATGDVTYTFTFSEVVNGFTVDDITISGGTAGTLSTSDNIIYSLVVTPTSDSTTDIIIDVAEDVVNDTESNGNLSATTNTQTVDTMIPSVTILDDTTGTATDDVTYTFTFSEVMNGFSVDDIIVTGGIKGGLSTSDNITYTLVITPESDSSTNITVNVAADVATDLAGNGNTVAATNTQAVDTQAPTATITETTGGDDEVVIGDNESVSIQSSEVGIGYLVHSSVTVTDVASITSLTGNLWNSVEIIAADTDTELSATGLDYGEYTFYSVDELGNLSDASDDSVYIADTSIVVFDLGSGNSSSHSDRTFESDVDYTIYFVIDSRFDTRSDPWATSDEFWGGESNLDPEDTIVFVGLGENPNYREVGFTNLITNTDRLILTGPGGLTFSLAFDGTFVIDGGAAGGFVSNQNLFVTTGRNYFWSGMNGTIGTAIPNSILTSQGLA